MTKPPPALVAWRIATLDGTDNETLSTAVASREDAIAWARALIARKTRVVRIQASDGRKMTPEEIMGSTPENARR